MKKKYGFMLAVAVLLAGCGQKKETSVITARPVKTTIVESRSIIRKDFSGIVEAVEYVKLAFRVSGQIINLPVIEGKKVKKVKPERLEENPDDDTESMVWSWDKATGICSLRMPDRGEESRISLRL